LAVARSSTKKQETHDRIVRTAARAIRREGLTGASVADVMAEAGLTHGGFYAHFANRDAMLAEAIEAAGTESAARLTKVADDASGDPLAAIVDSYLSDRHVENRELGCVIAATASEASRMPEEVRHVVTRRVKTLVDLVAQQMPDWGQGGAHDRALGIASAMIGALVIARLSDDPALGASVRAATKSLITAGAKKK
jgi:TetR/AcrR family transcriptional repressor of nem operon